MLIGTRSRLALVLAALVGLLAVGTSLGADEKKAPSKPATGKTEASADKQPAGKVYTNEDLKRLFGAASEPAAEAEPADSTGGETPRSAAGQAPAGDPLAALEEEKRREEARGKEIVEAERKVGEAQKKVDDLERRMIAVRNPLLARPEVPPELAEEWKSMDGPARVQRTEQDLKTAREELEQARQALESLRRG